MKALLAATVCTLVASLIGLVYLFTLAFEPVNWDLGWAGPVVLERTLHASEDSVSGLWHGVAFYRHDCPECATREDVWLDLAPDSTGWLIIRADNLDLFPIRLFGTQYGRSDPAEALAATVRIQDGCLVHQLPPSIRGHGWLQDVNPVRADILAREEALADSVIRAYRQRDGCPVSEGSAATSAVPFRREGETLVFDLLDSTFPLK